MPSAIDTLDLRPYRCQICKGKGRWVVVMPDAMTVTCTVCGGTGITKKEYRGVI